MGEIVVGLKIGEMFRFEKETSDVRLIDGNLFVVNKDDSDIQFVTPLENVNFVDYDYNRHRFCG